MRPVAGEPAEAFIAKHILEPLDMQETFPLVRTAGNKLDRFTPAYAGSRGNWARFLAMYLDKGAWGTRPYSAKPQSSAR